eukprot:COSAG02_NODE_4665_length_5128_cov_2.959936_2_plen_116_part_00
MGKKNRKRKEMKAETDFDEFENPVVDDANGQVATSPPTSFECESPRSDKAQDARRSSPDDPMQHDQPSVCSSHSSLAHPLHVGPAFCYVLVGTHESGATISDARGGETWQGNGLR